MRPRLESLEPRILLSVVTDHGGPVLAAPEVSVVYVGSASNSQPQFDALAQIMATDYARILAPYGVGPGMFRGSVDVAAPATLTDAWIQQTLAMELTRGAMPAPTANTLLMVYLPANVVDAWAQNDAAYHSTFQYAGRSIPYTVVFTQPGETIPASHEFAEAVTDPLPGTGWFAGSPETGEIADLYSWQPFTLDGFQVSQFAAPDGEALCGVGLTASAALAAIPAEEFFALAWHYVASMWPQYQGRADAAAATLAANPVSGEPDAAWSILVGEVFFVEAVGGAKQ